MISSSDEQADDPFDRVFDEDFVRAAPVKEPTARARQQAEQWRKLEVAELRAQRSRRRRRRPRWLRRRARTGSPRTTTRIALVIAILVALFMAYVWSAHPAPHHVLLPAAPAPQQLSVA